MLSNYFKITLRSLKRRPVFSIINITGLAMGIACSMLILLWVQDELSFDHFHEQGDRIFRIIADWEKNEWDGFEGTPKPLGPAATEQFPEIQDSARFASQSRKVFSLGGKSFYEDGGIIVDTSFFKMFTFPFVSGTPAAVFTGPNDIILTESIAKKYFGDLDPLNKTIEIDSRTALVKAVIEDIPSNSHIQFDYAQPFEYVDKLSGYGTTWGAFNFITYIQISGEPDMRELGRKITALALENNCPQVKSGVRFRLQPLYKVHLDARKYQRPGVALGDSRYVTLFSIVAFFILLIGCINFMNLSTARATLRAREVGLRKTVGAQRSQLALQFFCESLLLALLAGTAALLLIWMIMPLFNRLSGKYLTLNLLDPIHMLLLCGTVTLTGLISGLYPAVYLSGFDPVKVLHGAARSGKKGAGFRRILVVFQFSLSILLIIATTVVFSQIRFMKQQKLAFNKENIVFFPIKGKIGRQFTAVKQALLQNSDILGVTAQNYLFLDTSWRTTGVDWEGRDPEARRDIITHRVDMDFFEVMGMQLAEGRFFSSEFPTDEKEAFIINEEAVKQMGITPPVGKPFSFYISKDNILNGKIVGVIKNGHFRSLHNEIEPHIFLLNSNWAGQTNYGIILVKIDGNRTSEALAAVRHVWIDFNPHIPFEYHFLDSAYEKLYHREQQTSTIFNAFTVLAVLISMLGLFGLASFVAQRRVREIGIRKILGASEKGLVLLLSQQFARWVLLANIAAWPLAYLASEKWLENFAYRIKLSPWIFIMSGLSALFVALLTINLQAIRAARSNPVEALRVE